jgi:hypothetical protein
VTSVEQTILMTGDVRRLLDQTSPGYLGGDDGIRAIGLGLAGRFDEALVALEAMRARPNIPLFRNWEAFIRAWLERQATTMMEILPAIERTKVLSDPEATFRVGWSLCDVGAHEHGFPRIQRAVERGFFVSPTLARAPQFDAIRHLPSFHSLLTDAEAGRHRALSAFRDAGGERLLGR